MSDGTKRGADIIRSVGELLDSLSQSAEAARSIVRTGVIGDKERGVKGVYGFSIRLGAGAPTVERFGNIRAGSRPRVEPTSEPLVDVFDEGELLRIVVELPGVERSDVHYEIDGVALRLKAERGERRYAKEIELPQAVVSEQARSSCRNGVFELTLPKA